jgi:hypothetical protein
METLQKASPETIKWMEEKLHLMTSPELDALEKRIEALLEEKRRLKIAKTLTKEQLLSLYGGYGYVVKPGDKFWKIRHGKGEGFYGWQVGQFEHSCHIDSTDLIVLYVIEPGTPTSPAGDQYLVHDSEMWLEGPIVV